MNIYNWQLIELFDAVLLLLSNAIVWYINQCMGKKQPVKFMNTASKVTGIVDKRCINQ